MEKNENKGIKIIVGILVVLVLILGVAVVYLFLNQNTEVAKEFSSNREILNSNVTNIGTTSTNNTIANTTNMNQLNNQNNVVTNNTQINSNGDNSSSKGNPYEKIKGTYEYKQKDNDGRFLCSFILSLNDDGTFSYVTGSQIAAGYLGNYIINDSELTLNKLFSHGSDVGIGVSSGIYKLKVNSDGTISDSNKYNGVSISNVTLKKTSNKVGQDGNLSERIKSAIQANAIYAQN